MMNTVSVADFVRTYIGLAASEGRRAAFVQIGAGYRMSFNPFGPFLDHLSGHVVDPFLDIEDARFTGVRVAITRASGLAAMAVLIEAAIDQGLLPERWRALRSFALPAMLAEGGWLASACADAGTVAALRMLLTDRYVPGMPLDEFAQFYGIGALDMLAVSTSGTEAAILEQLDRLPSPPRGILVDLQCLLPAQRQQIAQMLHDRQYRTVRADGDLLAGYHEPARALARYVMPLREMARNGHAGGADAAAFWTRCADDLQHLADPIQISSFQDLIRAGRAAELPNCFERLLAVSTDRAQLCAELRPFASDLQAMLGRLIAAGEQQQAVLLARVLAEIWPEKPELGHQAIAVSMQENRPALAARFAHRVLAIDPDDSVAPHIAIDYASRIGALDQEYALRLRLLDSTRPSHPTLRLLNCFRLSWYCLQPPLTAEKSALLARCKTVASQLPMPDIQDREQHFIHRHCHAVLDALDPAFIQSAPVADLRDFPIFDHQGHPLDMKGVQRIARERGAGTALLVAGDHHYIQRYARFFIRSVLANQDEEVLIIVHAIGGLGKIAGIAQELGIDAPNLFFSADDFDETAHRGTAVEKDGFIDKPVAHYQCARFEVAASLTDRLGLRVIVADIDTLMLRGTATLASEQQGQDVCLNINPFAKGVGAIVTANLVMINPTAGTRYFMGALLSYLRRELARPVVTRWVDQIGLLLAKVHCESTGQPVRIGRFSGADINNDMFERYLPLPYRFLSLYGNFKLETIPETYR